jgi:Nif-specific regulatory protein
MLLADHFVERYRKEHGKRIGRISTTATDVLMSYHWPGNVRELENCIERAIILSSDGVIHGHLLPPNLQHADGEVGLSTNGSFTATMTNVEREMVVEELKHSRGNMAKAARALGITERMMGIRVSKYGIDPGRFRQMDKGSYQ